MKQPTYYDDYNDSYGEHEVSHYRSMGYDDYTQKRKFTARIPIWKGSAFLLAFASFFYWPGWATVIRFIQSLI